VQFVHTKFLLCNTLPGLNCIWNDVYENMCKNIFGRNIYVRSKFSVCACLTVCARARAHAHSLEGTLTKTLSVVEGHYITTMQIQTSKTQLI